MTTQKIKLRSFSCIDTRSIKFNYKLLERVVKISMQKVKQQSHQDRLISVICGQAQSIDFRNKYEEDDIVPFLQSMVTDPTTQFVFNGNFYQLVRSPLSFDDAISASSSQNLHGVVGHLLTIDSSEEDQVIWNNWLNPNALGNDVSENVSDVWIGISDAENEGHWVYTSGAKSGLEVDFQNWATGEPNNGQGGFRTEHTGVYSAFLGGWNDWAADEILPYIIEYEGTLLNSPTVGVLTVTGIPADGNNLVASVNEISDPDGDVSVTYRWQHLFRGTWFDISGASSSTLTIPSDHSLTDKSIRVVATATDNNGGVTEFVGTELIVLAEFKGTVNSDSIIGSSGDDRIFGLQGNDTLDGISGADLLVGGAGNDTYVTDGGDTIAEAANEGTDTIKSSVTYSLGANFENLTLTGNGAISGTGNALQNILIGNTGANALYGGDGDDTLNGGIGADTLAGGAGNDTYIVDGGDTITEAANAGIDTVQSSATITIAANVENLTLTGTGAINGTGNSVNNVLTGNSGNNVLNGATGADTLVGGAGNDTYATDGGDTITEAANAGVDTVQSSVTYMLGADLENLTLTGTAAINGTGNALSNLIVGNIAANSISGGDGSDTLEGGLGNDFLFGGLGADVLVGGAGVDALEGGSGSDTLWGGTENDSVGGEDGNDVLYGDEGNDQLWGNAGDDYLTGGAGNDLLFGGNGLGNPSLAGADSIVGDGKDTLFGGDGSDILHGLGDDDSLNGGSGNDKVFGEGGNDTLNGGTGVDTLDGGVGNDTYVTDGGDTITEAANAGTDTVQSSASHTLGSNVENLTLTGTGAIAGTGNTLNNLIVGNSAANAIYGAAGVDTLTGGAGNDTFVFKSVGETTILATTTDIITDFVQGQDKINLADVDAFAGTTVNDTFVWKGTAAFASTTQGEVRYDKFDNTGTANDYTMIWVDNDNDTSVEMAIRLTGLYNLAASDFIL